MKKIKVQIIPCSEDYWLNKIAAGKIATVIEISEYCNIMGNYSLKCELEDGDRLLCDSSQVKVLDLSAVPENYMENIVLQNAWVFGTARNDSYFKTPPQDKDKYREFYGVAWRESRLYDIRQWSFKDQREMATVS